MVAADGDEGTAISFWDRQEDADAYEWGTCTDVHKALEPFKAGTPELHK